MKNTNEYICGKTFTLYIHSNEHPRTINTMRNARTNFSAFYAHSEQEVINIYNALKAEGRTPYEIITPGFNRCDVRTNAQGEQYVYRFPRRGLAFCR